MAAATSIPAAALGEPGAPLFAEASHSDQTQSLAFSGGEIAAVLRDSYTATTPSQVAALQTMRTADTFTNVPGSAIQWPFPSGVPLSDRYGPRSCSGCSSFHKGLDMLPGVGTPIQVIADGTVLETGESDSGFGVYALIEHEVDGRKITSLYAHMQFGSLQLSAGQTVSVGDGVGRVGNTGQSTGPHLHLEIWDEGTPIDPYEWLTERVGR